MASVCLPYLRTASSVSSLGTSAGPAAHNFPLSLSSESLLKCTYLYISAFRVRCAISSVVDEVGGSSLGTSHWEASVPRSLSCRPAGASPPGWLRGWVLSWGRQQPARAGVLLQALPTLACLVLVS